MGVKLWLQRLADLLRSVALISIGLGLFAIVAPAVSAALGIYVVPQHNYPWGRILLYLVGPGLAGWALARGLDWYTERDY